MSNGRPLVQVYCLSLTSFLKVIVNGDVGGNYFKSYWLVKRLFQGIDLELIFCCSNVNLVSHSQTQVRVRDRHTDRLLDI